MEMRDLTCSSYVSLIVDTRNITGRHRPGNAWATLAPIPPLDSGSLLKGVGGVQGCGLSAIVLQRRDKGTAFALHTGGKCCQGTTTCRFPRLKGNHRSTVVRRYVLPQPLVVVGGILRRNTVTF